MSIVMGPVLGFRGQDEKGWHVCALVVTDGDKAPEFSRLVRGPGGEEVDTSKEAVPAPRELRRHGGKTVWRFSWSVAQTDAEQTVEYTVAGESNRFVVPRGDADRDHALRIAYASCNGFSSIKDMKKVVQHNAMWEVMRRQHEEPVYWEGMGSKVRPYHLLVLGGDQLYSDEIWGELDTLAEWNEQPDQFKAAEPDDRAKLRQEADAFYFELYCRQWSRPGVRKMLASVPTLMMWDDHDIFDGWGSYPAEQQEWPVFQTIFEAAREHFCLFQLQAAYGELEQAREKFRQNNWEGRLGGDARELPALLPRQSAFTYGYNIGDTFIAALDMRSERTRTRVMSDESREAFYGWLRGFKPGDCTNFILLSAIPVVFVNSAMLEGVFGFLPWQDDPESAFSLRDDIGDQWLSRPHRVERLRLINRLLDFADDNRCRVTIVSGDVHVGGMGQIEALAGGGAPKDAWNIKQLISSPIVHISGGGHVRAMEFLLGDRVEEIERGARDIRAQMLKFPTTGRYFIPARNWLSLTLDYKDRIWAEWFIEDTKPSDPARPYTLLSQVIYPVGQFSA